MRNMRWNICVTSNLYNLIDCRMNANASRALGPNVRLVNRTFRCGHFGQFNDLLGCSVRTVRVKKPRGKSHGSLVECFSEYGLHFTDFGLRCRPTRIVHHSASERTVTYKLSHICACAVLEDLVKTTLNTRGSVAIITNDNCCYSLG